LIEEVGRRPRYVQSTKTNRRSESSVHGRQERARPKTHVDRYLLGPGQRHRRAPTSTCASRETSALLKHQTPVRMAISRPSASITAYPRSHHFDDETTSQIEH